MQAKHKQGKFKKGDQVQVKKGIRKNDVGEIMGWEETIIGLKIRVKMYDNKTDGLFDEDYLRKL